MSTTDCSKAKNWGPVYFKRSALLGRIKNWICLVRRTAFILALDSPGRTKSMLSRYIFYDLDSSPAKLTRYRLVQFLKQLFSRYDSPTAYCFPRSISRWGRLASHAGVFRGARISSLPTTACSTENNIPFSLFYLRGKWPINNCAIKCWQAKHDWTWP